MNAEFGDANDSLTNPQIKQQLRLRGHQRHNAPGRKRYRHAPAHLVGDGEGKQRNGREHQ